MKDTFFFFLQPLVAYDNSYQPRLEWKCNIPESTDLRTEATCYQLPTIACTVVRMAERSKAPDSRWKPSQHAWESERSGLRMEAWVRIPLLTNYFSFPDPWNEIVWRPKTWPNETRHNSQRKMRHFFDLIFSYSPYNGGFDSFTSGQSPCSLILVLFCCLVLFCFIFLFYTKPCPPTGLEVTFDACLVFRPFPSNLSTLLGQVGYVFCYETSSHQTKRQQGATCATHPAQLWPSGRSRPSVRLDQAALASSIQPQ